MNRPWYAINARNLLDARRSGYMPQDPVIVSMLTDDAAYTYPPIFVKPDMPISRLDWSMLVNLEVWVWANATQPLDRVASLVVSIAKSMPRELVLRFEDNAGIVHDIDVGSGHHHNGKSEVGIEPEHDFFWLPLNLAMSKLGTNLKHALNRAHHGTAGP